MMKAPKVETLACIGREGGEKAASRGQRFRSVRLRYIFGSGLGGSEGWAKVGRMRIVERVPLLSVRANSFVHATAIRYILAAMPAKTAARA